MNQKSLVKVRHENDVFYLITNASNTVSTGERSLKILFFNEEEILPKGLVNSSWHEDNYTQSLKLTMQTEKKSCSKSW